jgi:hypothetical protein
MPTHKCTYMSELNLEVSKHFVTGFECKNLFRRSTMYVILKMAECLRESLECSVPRNTINNGLMQIYFDKVDKLCKLSSEVF